MKYLKTVILFCVCILLFSCYFVPSDKSSSSTEEIIPSWDSSTVIPGGNPENDALFIQENEITTFSLCDEQYWSSQGYTLWSFDKELSAAYSSLNFTIQKQSGTPEAGYGIIFAQYTTNTVNNMLILLLNTQGQYCVGELKNSKFYTLKSWTSHDCINKGYAVENAVSINYKNYKYQIKINNVEVYTIKKNSLLYTTGKVGYIAVISPKDNFPDERVLITYTKQ